MGCSECNGYALSRPCPLCSEDKEPIEVPCEECNGEGFYYLDENDNEVTREDYEKFPYKYTKVECDYCNGRGYFEEYEDKDDGWPDEDPYYDRYEGRYEE